VLSVLTLIGFWLRGWRWYWLLISAVLGGLALLSKQVSWFLPPLIIVLGGLTLIYRIRLAFQISNKKPEARQIDFELSNFSFKKSDNCLFSLIRDSLIWGGIAALTFFALFPAMWVIPAEVIETMFRVTIKLADIGHPHFLFGEISYAPGLLFYPTGWILRATSLEVIGVLGVILATVWHVVRKRSVKNWILSHQVELALLLYVVFLFLFINLSQKKWYVTSLRPFQLLIFLLPRVWFGSCPELLTYFFIFDLSDHFRRRGFFPGFHLYPKI
jgi:hypothetical protein